MERDPAADDDTQDSTVTNLNMKRRRQNSELQPVLSQLAVLHRTSVSKIFIKIQDDKKTHYRKFF